jgi:hypothetical protein
MRGVSFCSVGVLTAKYSFSGPRDSCASTALSTELGARGLDRGRPRSRSLHPNDDELSAVEPFGFAPWAAVSRRIRRVDRLGDRALKTELAGMPPDEFAVASLMTIELNAGLVRE